MNQTMLKQFALLALGLGIALVGPSTPSTAESTKQQVSANFLVFQALQFQDNPNFTKWGLRPINIIYASAFWPKNEPRDKPRENAVRALARRVEKRDQLVCIDIEHWISDLKSDDASANLAIEKYARLADWMHHAEPSIRMGFYAVPPIREYWPVIRGGEGLQAWHAQNKRLERLARHVDVVYPSLYTFYDDPEKWKKYAIANLKQARRYQKPVYAFLMPTYHPSNEDLAGQWIGGEFWRMQLETCRQYADGVVIWGSWADDRAWNPEAQWWQQTVEFMRQGDESTDAVEADSQ